jgi:DNA polymerase-3 subunit delta'
MSEGLCHDISLKPFMGGRRIAIIDDADLLNEEGANCLLKTLEEPPPRSVLILIGTSANKQYTTIRSRSQIVRFDPLPNETVARLLIEHHLSDDPTMAQRLAGYSEGSVQQAVELADPALWTFRNDLLSRLVRPVFSGVRLAETTIAFVKEAGTDAPPRRARCRQIIAFVVEFYRQLLRAMSGATPTADTELQSLVDRALQAWPADEDRVAVCLNRCLEALGHIDRNANQNTMLECWLDDLAAISAGQAILASAGDRR